MRKACILGWPVRHSRSPLIHAHWLAQHGIEGSYERVEVTRADFESVVRDMPNTGFVGGNATLPHKESLLKIAAHRTPAAEAAGAANTLWFEQGAICCDNTDISGFLANLDAGAPGWDRQAETAVVLGAGGAARGIVYGLLQRGLSRIVVANRTFAAAEDLRAAFGPAVQPLHWQEAERALVDADLLVNTTSLGMVGQPALELSVLHLPPHAVVSDVVYVPLETELLARARLRGHVTVGGLGMLLHQAVPGFARWFGVTPEVTPALTRLIEAHVRGEA
jgi:shikimate dehydrogenase